MRDRQHDPAEEQEPDEEAVREGKRCLGPERAGEEQAETREREGPEHQHGRDEEWRDARARSPAQHGRRDRDEQDHLRDLHDQDGQHLGRDEAAPGHGRTTQPFQHPILPFVGRGDAKIHEACRDDGQGHGPGQEEVDR